MVEHAKRSPMRMIRQLFVLCALVWSASEFEIHVLRVDSNVLCQRRRALRSAVLFVQENASAYIHEHFSIEEQKDAVQPLPNSLDQSQEETQKKIQKEDTVRTGNADNEFKEMESTAQSKVNQNLESEERLSTIGGQYEVDARILDSQSNFVEEFHEEFSIIDSHPNDALHVADYTSQPFEENNHEKVQNENRLDSIEEGILRDDLKTDRFSENMNDNIDYSDGLNKAYPYADFPENEGICLNGESCQTDSHEESLFDQKPQENESAFFEFNDAHHDFAREFDPFSETAPLHDADDFPDDIGYSFEDSVDWNVHKRTKTNQDFEFEEGDLGDLPSDVHYEMSDDKHSQGLDEARDESKKRIVRDENPVENSSKSEFMDFHDVFLPNDEASGASDMYETDEALHDNALQEEDIATIQVVPSSPAPIFDDVYLTMALSFAQIVLMNILLLV